MCFIEVRGSMRLLVVSGILLIFLSSVSGAGGINEQMSLEGTGLVDINYQDYVEASESFQIEIELDSQASENETEVIWVTQICINTGVCYPPESNDQWLTEDGKKLINSIDIDEDASYINWRFKMNWSDGDEENFPETGFGWKVWSSCWFDGENWGGIDDSCNSEKSESKITSYSRIISIMAVFTILFLFLSKKFSN